MSRATETVVLCLLVGWVVAEEMTLSINVKKPLAVVSEKFLSVTIDPAFMSSEALSDVEKCTSMAKALSPAYVRIGGPRSNSYVFERGLYPQETHADPGYILSEKHWIRVHQWAEKSGLDVIAVIAPQQSESLGGTKSTSWDPRNALDLISFSDHLGYNTSWQLGYECQTRCDVSGGDLGRDVQRLRNMLDAFPRYAERALIAGPDIVTHKTRLQQQYLQEYFNAASAALSTVTWHPDFASISIEAEGVSMHLDGLALEKDSLYRIIGRHVVKKPLWIAESRPEECKHQFLGALVWARRLGNAAKLGVQVIMRQPDIPYFFKPTPDYWVSVLHKMLVGQEVLDTRIATGNRTHVHFYSHCSRPSEIYEPGSVTVFGINLTPSKVTVNLKGLKLKVVHKYILLPGYDAPNRMFSESTLLNNEPLNLINGREIPDIKPVVTSAERGLKLKLPSGAIGFWVLPGLKMKTCMGYEDELPDKNSLRKLTTRIDDVETNEEFTSEEGNRKLSEMELMQGDRRRLTRQQQQPGSLFKRLLFRWSNRHREEERDETSQNRSYRRDLDRPPRRRDYHQIGAKRLRNDVTNEMITENINSDFEETMRSKIEDYKRRLTDSKKKNKKMDTDKVIEALTLITKVENAMNNLEKEDLKSKAQVAALNSSTPAADGSAKVTPAPAKGSNAMDDVLLVEVLNTDKSKGTTIPVTIEEQIKALYQLLSDEKDKKDGTTSFRQKRDLNEGQETASIQQRDTQQRKRSKSEELRERRLERLNERRQRMRGRLEMRNAEREQQEDEANFYGFQQRPPPKDFPQGDVYFEASNNAQTKDLRSSFQSNDPWARSGRQPEHADHDYYENLKMREMGIKANPKSYGEFLDGNDLNKGDLRPANPPPLGEPMPFKGVEERPVKPPLDNHRSMEQPQQQFVPYFETNHQQEFYGFKDPSLFQQPNINFYQPLPPPPSPYFQQDISVAPMQNFHQEQPMAPIQNFQLNPPVAQIQNFPQELPMTPMQNFQQELPIAPIQNFQQEPLMSPMQNFQQEPPVAPMQNFQQEPPMAPMQNFQQEPPMAPMQNFQQEPPVAPIQNFQQEPPTAPMQTFQQEPLTAPLQFYPGQSQPYIEPVNYFIDPREQGQNPEKFHYRTKRQASNLEDILQQEMILQDDNNLRDCQCRVIRGNKDCGDCGDVIINQEKLSSNAVYQYDRLDNHLTHLRRRRNTENDGDIKILSKEVVLPTCPPVEEETIESTSNAAVEEETEEENAEEEEEVQEEEEVPEEETTPMSEEDANSAKEIEESTTEIIKDYLKPETHSDKLLANRLPRKIGSQLQFFPTGRAVSKIQSKEDSLKDKKEAARLADISNIPTRPKAYEPISATEERLAKARFINYSIGQSTNSASSETTIKAPKETTVEKQINSKISNDVGNKNSEVAKQSTIDLKQTINNQRTQNQHMNAPVPEDPIKPSLSTSKLKTTSKNSQIATLDTESNNKLKSEFEKINDPKNRQARLTTRAEALAALRKENESRRVKKMIEASLRMLDSENERFLEYQKKRQEQLERLRMKLRAKRERLLEQYRDELLEVINESRDPEKRSLYRRDLLHFETPLEAEKSDDEKSSNRPSRSLDDQLQGEISDEVQEQNYESENTKRSTDNPVNSFSKFKWRNRYRKRPQVEHIDDESDEYYSNEEPESFYYPNGMYSTEEAYDRKKDIQLQMEYHQRPQQPFFNMHNIDPANVNEDGNYHFYSVNEYAPIEDIPHNYYSYEIPSHHSGKVKRSSLKHVEIDPAMYEEDEPDYNEQELLMRPASHISLRTYRHYPHELIDTRYKREAVLNDGEILDVPMSISLGLLKSKMKKSKTKLATTSEDLIRRKRFTEDPTQKSSSINKNAKKAYFADYEDSFKKFPDRSDKTIIKRIIKSINRREYDDLKNRINNEANSKRKKRSHESNMSRYRLLTDNDIDRSDDSEMDDIWNNIIEMKQDEELLQEYSRHKGEIMQDFRDSQKKLQQIIQTTMVPFSEENKATNTKPAGSTTQTNIESIFVDAIPKLENVITGGIKKAQNLTGTFEDFLVTLDDQYEETTASNFTVSMESEEENDGRLSHNLFKTVVANVKKFFGMVTGFTKIFHGH